MSHLRTVGLALRITAWSVVMPLLKRWIRLTSLVRLMWKDPGHPERADSSEDIIRLTARAARVRPTRRANCLERSLLAYRFLSGAGADARLVIGVRSDGSMIAGHAWVLVDGAPIHDTPETIADFVPVMEFGAGGSSTESSDAETTVGQVQSWSEE
jgi:hypothetical protein